MKIVKIDSNIDKDILRIELFLGNICNYRCWYCFPGSNEGNFKWPELDPLVSNLSHLIEYYIVNLNKKKFLLHIIGGEPTLWPDLRILIQELKEKYKVIVSISTNGSRSLRWWNENSNIFDHVLLSCHHQYINLDHMKTLGDLLYKKNVNLSAIVLMDPSKWATCTSIIDDLKKSKYRWPITALEVFHQTVNYTDEQKKYISKSLKRIPNLFWWWKTKCTPNKKATVFFADGKKLKVPHNWLSLNQLNKFNGWKCGVGVDTLFINPLGDVSGACGEKLYDLDYKYNIFDKEFKTKFNPLIKFTTCTKNSCDCQPEINASKYIPIEISK